jgi:hypothetical protein
MAAKVLTKRKSGRLSNSEKLRDLLRDQLTLANRLTKMIEAMEEEEDHRSIARAKKMDAGKPGIPWSQAKKKLGLKS